MFGSKIIFDKKNKKIFISILNNKIKNKKYYFIIGKYLF